jgi:hypothetical protein
LSKKTPINKIIYNFTHSYVQKAYPNGFANLLSKREIDLALALCITLHLHGSSLSVLMDGWSIL